jgi:thiamine pyrophosphokinase
MRGLLFTGGEMPDMAIAALYFGEYRFTVAADSGLEAALRAGIIPDMVTGDMDSVSSRELLNSLPPERVERWNADKDYTDTELALMLMERQQVDDVVLIGGSGGRLDHLFAIERMFSRAFCPSLWVSRETLIAVVDSTGPRSTLAIRGLEPADPVSVFAVSASGSLSCGGDGLVWTLDSVDWDAGAYSLSNRSETGSAVIKAASGRFLVTLPLREGIGISYR